MYLSDSVGLRIKYNPAAAGECPSTLNLKWNRIISSFWILYIHQLFFLTQS